MAKVNTEVKLIKIANGHYQIHATHKGKHIGGADVYGTLPQADVIAADHCRSLVKEFGGPCRLRNEAGRLGTTTTLFGDGPRMAK